VTPPHLALAIPLNDSLTEIEDVAVVSE